MDTWSNRFLRWFGWEPVDRITAKELKRRLDSGDRVEILDLRRWSEVLDSGEKLPGSRWLDGSSLVNETRPDGDYVLYCR